MKSFGISGRARLFEVIQKVREINKERRNKLEKGFSGSSYDLNELKKDSSLSIDFISAPPRMALYIDYSAKIYKNVYLKYIAPEDIHVYSIDEVFIDLTSYLKYSKMNQKYLRQCINVQ